KDGPAAHCRGNPCSGLGSSRPALGTDARGWLHNRNRFDCRLRCRRIGTRLALAALGRDTPSCRYGFCNDHAGKTWHAAVVVAGYGTAAISATFGLLFEFRLRLGNVVWNVPGRKFGDGVARSAFV